MAAGSAKIEQSDVLEVFLTVTEAAVDYFNPPQQKLEELDREGPPVVLTKFDRIRGTIKLECWRRKRTEEKTFRMMTLLSCFIIFCS